MITENRRLLCRKRENPSLDRSSRLASVIHLRMKHTESIFYTNAGSRGTQNYIHKSHQEELVD